MSAIQQQILLLTPEERLQLLQYILDTIRIETFSHPEGEHTDAQMQELDRRLKSIDDGTATFLNWEEINSTVGQGMSYSLRFLSEARADIYDAYVWYETKRNGLGDEFADAMEVMFERI